MESGRIHDQHFRRNSSGLAEAEFTVAKFQPAHKMA